MSADGDPALPTRAFDPRLARRLERLGMALLASFAVVALTLAYWSAVRSDALSSRPDNPRLVEAERRVRRGRIVEMCIRDRPYAAPVPPMRCRRMPSCPPF